MKQDLFFAGSGGQGILMMGEIFSIASMNSDKYVTCYPSYGAEVRGGTANCSVVISSQPIASPIAKYITCGIIMNPPSMTKFADKISKNGILLINSSLIKQDSVRSDVTVYKINATEIANGLGNIMTANMVMLGKLTKALGIISIEKVIESMTTKMSSKKPGLIEINKQAIMKGYEA